MAYYTDDMPHTATYWAPAGGVDRYGRATLAAPVTIICRWQGKRELIRDAQGRQAVSSSVVYVGAGVEAGGWMSQDDYTAVPDPRGVVSIAHEIMAVGSSADLDDEEELIKAWL